MSPRGRVALELSVLAVATVVFLLLVPDRPTAVDVGLALFALLLVASNARFTREEVWGRFPPLGGRPDPRASWTRVMGATVPAVLLLMGIGVAVALRDGGPDQVAARILKPGLLLAVAVYFAWALLQQTLFQFFLLGRLRLLFEPAPRWVPVTLTGMAYSLVHLPDPWVTGVTAAAGVFWSAMYDRYRVLTSLALSHAILGACFYYWVYGRDLAATWLGFLR